MDTFENEPTKEQRIWQTVAAIPQGKVASYGQVAARRASLAVHWASCPPATTFPGTGLSGATARSLFLKAQKPASFKPRN